MNLDEQLVDTSKLTDAQRIKLAKQAYAEYLHAIHDLSVEQKVLLNVELHKVEQLKIEELRKFIQSM